LDDHRDLFHSGVRKGNTIMDIGLLVLRLALGTFVAGHGIQKLTHHWGGGGLSASSAEFRHDGFAGGRITALFAGTVQVGAGILLVLGLATPLASAGVLGVMVIATGVKIRVGFWSQDGGFEYPLILSLLAVAVAWTGPGSLSLDRLIGIQGLPWWVAAVATVAGLAGAGLLRLALYRKALVGTTSEAHA
jgi:putative oxidoreductase